MLTRRDFAAMLVLSLCTPIFAQAPSQKAQAMIDKGLEFLKSQQKPDGGWQGEHEPPAFTALVLRAAMNDGGSYNTDWIKKGYDRLLAQQVGDGGIYSSELTCYNTAIVLTALSSVADQPQMKEPINKALSYLRGFQWNDKLISPKGTKVEGPQHPWYGGWGYEGNNGRPDLSNTQVALEALHDAGLKPDDPAYKAAISFLSRMQNHSETNDQPWASNDGGFIYSPGEDSRGDSKAGEYTDANGKRLLRSYGSMTYAGLKSFIYAGLTKDDPRVKAAWDWVTRNWTLDENPGMRLGNPEAARQGLFYYYMTLARALNEYDQPVITDPQNNKHDWRVELINKLASIQKPDGSWTGEQRWMEGNPVLSTCFTVLALEEATKDLKEHPAQGM